MNDNRSIIAVFREIPVIYPVRLGFNESSVGDPDGLDRAQLGANPPFLKGSTAPFASQMGYYPEGSNVVMRIFLHDPENYYIASWSGFTNDVVDTMKGDTITLYVNKSYDINARILPKIPLVLTEIVCVDKIPDPEETTVNSEGGYITYLGMVTLHQPYTIRVTYKMDETNTFYPYVIGGWTVPVGVWSDLKPGITTSPEGEDPRWIEREIVPTSLLTVVRVQLVRPGSGNRAIRPNIVEGGKFRHDDVPTTKSSGHFIDNRRPDSTPAPETPPDPNPNPGP